MRHFIRKLFIRSETTPNVDSLKFFPGKSVLSGTKTFDFQSIAQARSSGAKMAAALLGSEGIHSVFYGPDFVTVTKKENFNWDALRPVVYSVMTEHLTGPMENLTEPTQSVPETEIEAMIKEIIESRIRPSILEDGGDVEFISFDEETGTVNLALQGACRTCESSVVTLHSGIENMLRYYIPEVKRVEQVAE